MDKTKISKYIVIGIIILLIIILAVVISNKHKSNPNKLTEQSATSTSGENKPGKAVTAEKLSRGTSILWAITKRYDGNLGGRQGADKICQEEKPSGLHCSNIHAFISIRQGDAIKDMVKNYKYEASKPISWYNRSTNTFTQAANNWQDLLDGSIMVSASDGLGSKANYWVGSLPDGSLNSKNCRNWTSNGPTISGAEGRGGVKDARWLGKGSLSCQGEDNLLCICQK